MSLLPATAEQIEHWAIDELVPYERNARTHSPDQVGKIMSSMMEFGFTNPILVAGKGILAGHGRLMAARELGLTTVPVIRLDHLDDAQQRAYILADNRLALDAGWDEELLATELRNLADDGYDLQLTGFNEDEIDDLFAMLDEDDEPSTGTGDEEATPEPPVEPVTKLGDIFRLGNHRVMCGDSTSISDVEKLMNGNKAQLLHADPPYGMGKASDGVANDNIYEEDLDKFQMEWWTTFRTFMLDNSSAYIWGNAPDLWRLWYRGGLGDSERLELRNQIVWDKKHIPGMKSPDLTQYPITTEHALFFQVGEQFKGNINIDDFPESWEMIRGYLGSEADAAGIQPSDIKNVCGVGMFSHWFTRSQFNLIPEKHYTTLAAHYPGRFLRAWKDIKRDWDAVKSIPTLAVQEKRSYFDNAHDIMRDVWEFSRVVGDERHGHATPKPVAMMERVMNSSLPKGGLCVEPFGGSGSTLIGAEKTGRVCYIMELQPKYCDVIIKRWQDFTGRNAVHVQTEQTFNELTAERKG